MPFYEVAVDIEQNAFKPGKAKKIKKYVSRGGKAEDLLAGKVVAPGKLGASGMRMPGFDWPDRCPCCGGAKDGFIPVSKSSGGLFAKARVKYKHWVPYCNACLRHNQMHSIWSLLNLLVLALAYLIAYVIQGGYDLLFFIWFAGVSLIGLGLSYLFLQMVVKPRLKETCVSRDLAVRFKGWQGTVHTFRFKSRDYAADFAHANGSDLYDVSG